MLRLDSNDLSLGFPRVLGSFRETIAIILRHLLFNNGWGQYLKKKEKKKEKIYIYVWIMLCDMMHLK